MAPGRAPDFKLCDEYYGLAWDEQMRDFSTHLFEPHTDNWYLPNKPNYIADVNETEKPVYVQELGRFEREILYPDTGFDWFESSFAYMIALAISKNPQEIHIWGVRMAAEEEYWYQRENCSYLIGYARGKGIKVHIYNSTVCQYSRHFDKYPERYGKTGVMNAE